MKNLFVLSFILLATVSASATGLKMPVYICKGGTGEAAGSIEVHHITMSAPGGPATSYYTATASASWIAGTHFSDEVTVERKELSRPVGAEKFVNRKAGFSITVEPFYADESGRPTQVRVRGTFRDPQTGMKAQLVPMVYDCE